MRTNFRSTYGCVQCGIEWRLVEKELSALRSENARLTEEVRGAEGAVEVLRNIVASYDFGTTTPWGPRVPYLYEHMHEAKKALSIYNEGAAGRSGSASPQSGDEPHGSGRPPSARTEAVE